MLRASRGQQEWQAGHAPEGSPVPCPLHAAFGALTPSPPRAGPGRWTGSRAEAAQRSGAAEGGALSATDESDV